MNIRVVAAVLATAAATSAADPAGRKPIKPEAVWETSLGGRVGQLRAAPVRLGPGRPDGLFVVYGPDFDVDPFHEMFFYPKGTLTVAVLSAGGEVLWSKDLGRGVVPGVWFCPVYPFDLDADGVDEIYLIDNPDPDHPLSIGQYRLAQLDARTGKVTATKPWPKPEPGQSISHSYRNFILGGMAGKEPVLVTAQGTYGAMALQGWNTALKPRWEYKIAANSPGARGSHITPVVDFDGDGVEEVMWGERRVELGRGKELYCADRDTYKGHSDVIQPVLDRATGAWTFFTCRESDRPSKPRVALYDGPTGRRVWGDIDDGHMDMGWAAHPAAGRGPVAMSIRIDGKKLGPDGRTRIGVEEFTYDALTGKPWAAPFAVYQTIPVDVDGDGHHEFVRGIPGGDGDLLDAKGVSYGKLGGTVALAAKFLDRPGEQVLCYYPDGKLRAWADANARDSDAALKRYAHPYYRANRRLAAVGYNVTTLGGL